jgi:hypothetical protein
LVNDSGSVNAEIGTMKFGSSPGASEVETSFLTHPATAADVNRSTKPTTVLDAQRTVGETRKLGTTRRRKTALLLIAAIMNSQILSTSGASVGIDSSIPSNEFS